MSTENQRTLSWPQRLVKRFLGARAGEAERQSREWFVICPKCGHERSWWDIGGVRYGARSKGKRLGLRCPACGKFRMHKVERRPGVSPPAAG